ncbi:DUF2867 domain-containing protein [Oxalobacteraceae bacterium]|nr:DUF2867 domain-containing protein [Oxalobacteraceae bacterium]
MPNQNWPVNAVAVPAECSIAHLYPHPYLADAFAIGLPANASTDPEQLARFIFGNQPPWVSVLLRIRDALVSLFGLKTTSQLGRASGQRVGFFRIYATSAREIILGEDDSHLDFRASLLVQPAGGAADGANVGANLGEPLLVLTTVVNCHNWLGRAYITIIAPFHRMVVRANLRRGARLGWPLAAAQTESARRQ